MNVVILGAGKTGAFVASVLSLQEHNVILIDKDAVTLEKVGREIDVATLHSSGPSWKLLEELSTNHPDVFFAATGDDETNLVACAIAKNVGFPKVIARIKTSDYLNHPKLDFKRLFFVDYFIGAELLAAQDLFKVLVHEKDLGAEQFAHGAIQMNTIRIPDHWPFGNAAIHTLPLPENLIVAAIHREKDLEEKLIIPHGQDRILPGDEITIFGETTIMNQLHEIFHIEEKKIRSVILVGGSSIALHLAQFLSQQRIKVRIIESDPLRCGELADLLPHATIINRDGRDSALLTSERVQDANALVACLENEGTNFLIASLARKLGCLKCVALISDPLLSSLLEKLEVTAVLSARANLTNRILSILHKDTIVSIASLVHSQVKIVELKVARNSKAIGIPLSKLTASLPKNLLIAIIEHQGKVLIGKGNSVLSPDDIVIAICLPEHIPQLQTLFHPC